MDQFNAVFSLIVPQTTHDKITKKANQSRFSLILIHTHTQIAIMSNRYFVTLATSTSF